MKKILCSTNFFLICLRQPTCPFYNVSLSSSFVNNVSLLIQHSYVFFVHPRQVWALRTCLNDCNPNNIDVITYYETLDQCCEAEYTWEGVHAHEECKKHSTGSTPRSVDDSYYVDWTVGGKCVKNCEVSEGGGCGGINHDSAKVEHDNVQTCCRVELKDKCHEHNTPCTACTDVDISPILPRPYIGLIGHWEGSVSKIVILLMVYIVEVIFQVGRLLILILQSVAKIIVGIRPLLVKDVPMYHIEQWLTKTSLGVVQLVL